MEQPRSAASARCCGPAEKRDTCTVLRLCRSWYRVTPRAVLVGVAGAAVALAAVSAVAAVLPEHMSRSERELTVRPVRVLNIQAEGARPFTSRRERQEATCSQMKCTISTGSRSVT